MVKKYTAIRKELAEAKIGMTHEIYIKELKDCHRHTVRVVHVGMLAQVVYLLNDNDTVMYTVKVKSHNQYSIQSIGQTLVNEIVCNSGEHGIHVKLGRICIPVDDVHGEVKIGDIIKGVVSDNDYEVRFVEGNVIVVKSLKTGNTFCHDEPTIATFNYKGLSYE